MKIIRAALLASAVAMIGVIPAAAQQAATPAPSPEAIAVAKELVAVMSTDMLKDMTNNMLTQMWPPMEQTLKAQFPQMDAAAFASLNAEIRAELEKQVMTEVSAMMETSPVIYARHLTVEEMRDIQAFYRTPAGAKALKVMPQIMGEVMADFGPRLQAMGQRINVAISGILQKHGYGPK
jgi:uncharacterized protein